MQIIGPARLLLSFYVPWQGPWGTTDTMCEIQLGYPCGKKWQDTKPPPPPKIRMLCEFPRTRGSQEGESNCGQRDARPQAQACTPQARTWTTSPAQSIWSRGMAALSVGCVQRPSFGLAFSPSSGRSPGIWGPGGGASPGDRPRVVGASASGRWTGSRGRWGQWGHPSPNQTHANVFDI